VRRGVSPSGSLVQESVDGGLSAGEFVGVLLGGSRASCGFCGCWWLDLAWLPLGDGGRRWRVRIWELEELVRSQARFWARASRSTAQSPQIRRPQNTRYILSIMILGL